MTTTTINKTICIGTIRGKRIVVTIEYSDGKLSICGDIGRGEGGQVVMSFKEYDKRGHHSIADVSPAAGLTSEDIRKLFDTWERWHGNDMRPNCEHQVGPEWEAKEVTLYHWRLTPVAQDMRRRAEQRAASMAAAGKVETATDFDLFRDDEKFVLSAPYLLTTAESSLDETRNRFYLPATPLYEGASGKPTETKLSTWVRPSEHPDGLLCKPCAVCGYEYGTAWKHETVPDDVVAFLASFGDVRPDPTADVNVGDGVDDELTKFLASNLITVAWRYIPLSERNRNERQLKWKMMVRRNGRAVFDTEYFAGEGHCPSYKQAETVHSRERVDFELETGRAATGVEFVRAGREIKPDVNDFFESLYRDSDVLNHPTFESWAEYVGYDSDSRSAKEIYDKCMANSLKLRNLLGDDGLALLADALA